MKRFPATLWPLLQKLLLQQEVFNTLVSTAIHPTVHPRENTPLVSDFCKYVKKNQYRPTSCLNQQTNHDLYLYL